MITATLQNMGKIYKGQGETVTEAIESIPTKNLKGKSILVVGKKEVILPVYMTNRLSSANPNVRSIIIKNIAMRFK